jgi:hypothetical protein
MTALCWALWISMNDLVFHKSQYKSILQVIFRGKFWIRSWSVLSKEDGRTILKVVVSWRPSLWTSFISLGGTLLSVLRTSVWVAERLACLFSYLVCLVNLCVLVQPRCCLDDRCVSVCSGSLDVASWCLMAADSFLNCWGRNLVPLSKKTKKTWFLRYLATVKVWIYSCDCALCPKTDSVATLFYLGLNVGDLAQCSIE